MIVLKSKRELELMRVSGAVAAEVLRDLKRLIRPGLSTGELDRKGGELIRARGAESAFRGYHDYPGQICISIDEEVVHGIGGARLLKEGEIVSLDVGVRKNGYIGDTAATFPVGRVSPEKDRLMRVTEECLRAGIARTRVGNRLFDISAAIQRTAEAAGFSVVRDFVGHGVGAEMHEDPQVPNYGRPGTGIPLKAGMVLALEPMVTVGGSEVEILDDRWTVVTRDRSPAAHAEHTVAVTEEGPEILTCPKMPSK
jgi:methionyl aminopeptidase